MSQTIAHGRMRARLHTALLIHGTPAQHVRSCTWGTSRAAPSRVRGSIGIASIPAQPPASSCSICNRAAARSARAPSNPSGVVAQNGACPIMLSSPPPSQSPIGLCVIHREWWRSYASALHLAAPLSCGGYGGVTRRSLERGDLEARGDAREDLLLLLLRPGRLLL